MSKTFRYGAPKKRDWRGKYKKPKKNEKNKKSARRGVSESYDDFQFFDDCP